MYLRRSVASNVAWRMTKIHESIDQPMWGIGSKPSWMTAAAQSLFGTLITMNDGNNPMRAGRAAMFVRLLVIGLTCWFVMFSPAEATPAERTDAPPLFDNLGSL